MCNYFLPWTTDLIPYANFNLCSGNAQPVAGKGKGKSSGKGAGPAAKRFASQSVHVCDIHLYQHV